MAMILILGIYVLLFTLHSSGHICAHITEAIALHMCTHYRSNCSLYDDGYMHSAGMFESLASEVQIHVHVHCSYKCSLTYCICED